MQRRESDSNDDWESIDFVDSEYFGEIIGKEGRSIKDLQTRYGVKIIIKGSVIGIKGSEEARNKIKLHFINFISQKKPRKYMKKKTTKNLFFVGLKDDDQLTLGTSSHCRNSSHCEIIAVNKSVDTNKAYHNVQNLKEDLLGVFRIVKAHTEDDPNAYCFIMVRGDRMHYWNEPGSYIMSDLVENPKVKHERLSHDSFAFEEIESLPVVRKVIRYDYGIFTPAPIATLRYRVYLCETENKDGMVIQEFSNIRTDPAPGYFRNPQINVSKFDFAVVDPTTNYTTTLNIRVCKPDHEEEKLIKAHSDNLKVAFQRIKVIKNGSEFDLTKLELPDDYLLTYYRRSERNEYHFESTNILRTTKDTVDSQDGEDMTGVFFVNETMNGLLKSEDWTVGEVVDCIENILKFSDTMMQHLI